MTLKSDIRKEVEDKIHAFLLRHEFFWISELRSYIGATDSKHANQVEQKKLKTAYFGAIESLKEKNIIQCVGITKGTRTKALIGRDKQYLSTIFKV